MPHIVVARSNESLDWLQALPGDWQVLVYNAGEPLAPADQGAHVTVVPCPAGLPAAALLTDCVLRHLAQVAATSAPAADVTVYTPGNPFLHAPDFLALLAHHARFAAVQPLSIGTGLAADLAQQDQRDWLDDLPVRAERYALATLAPLASASDNALRAGRAYRRKHGLADGDNLMAHFLALVGLDDLAEQARLADLGLCVHGPLFAVRRAALVRLAQRLAPQATALRTLARADQNYPEVFQHAWLHLFGLPFISLTGLSGLVDAQDSPQARAAAPTMSRVVASIDAVLAQAEPATRRLRPVTAAIATPGMASHAGGSRQAAAGAPPVASVASLREQARQAAMAGDLRTAWARLEQGLQLAPRHIDLLADAAALAYRHGDNHRAIHCARRALAVDADHLDCLFTLGMGLAAVGQTDEALDILAWLDNHPQGSRWQADHPDLSEQVHHRVGTLRQHAGVAGLAGLAQADTVSTSRVAA